MEICQKEMNQEMSKNEAEHNDRLRMLKEKMIALEATLDSNASSHRDAEAILRKKTERMESELKNIRQKYNTDMADLR
eukprot:CAMPEP_0197349338 /NCGR_PEP_ID=MMETSP0893-20130614/9482_1 /TAXON_ID=44058 ORGANISM="Aureoumbra lagunensis, Strain CCMP1510" /NCGR_SAMPLE_ID=MMETSP0893 /ASSEMBLY_ACC=CAM_ASM_000539 /LENGTH=77 /DNA_ID=CAMNT_0042860561 /DNA_START=1 /DNA_END=230 /DNA_ORIENTATION=-